MTTFMSKNSINFIILKAFKQSRMNNNGIFFCSISICVWLAIQHQIQFRHTLP